MELYNYYAGPEGERATLPVDREERQSCIERNCRLDREIRKFRCSEALDAEKEGPC